jgi:hypothetical protein
MRLPGNHINICSKLKQKFKGREKDDTFSITLDSLPSFMRFFTIKDLEYLCRYKIYNRDLVKDLGLIFTTDNLLRTEKKLKMRNIIISPPPM